MVLFFLPLHDLIQQQYPSTYSKRTIVIIKVFLNPYNRNEHALNLYVHELLSVKVLIQVGVSADQFLLKVSSPLFH